MVSVLLLLTILYCVRLNRQLRLLKADEQTLRATISELITATEIAERAIAGLKSTMHDGEQNLSERLGAHGASFPASSTRSSPPARNCSARIGRIASAAQAAPPRAQPAVPDAKAVAAAAQAFAARAQARIGGRAA